MPKAAVKEAPADEATEAPEPSLSFEDVAEVPPVVRGTRERKPTRFDNVVKTLEPDSKKGKRFTVPVSELKKVRRELTSAGLACDPPVTVAMNVTEDGDNAVVIISAKKKVTQNRKPKNEDAAADE